MSDQNQHPEEKEWSEIRNEIMRKVELFTDRQIERFKASIHKRTAPRDESESEAEEPLDLTKEIEKLDHESGRAGSLSSQGARSRMSSHKRHKRKSA